MSLQDVEKIFALEDTIFCHICAMNSILDFVTAVFCSQGIGFQIFGDLRVVWTYERSETFYGIFLSYLEHD
jgi:hypothetical protein